MILHALIFLVIFGVALCCKKGWIHLGDAVDQKSIRMFLLAAVCGNLLGIVLTATGGTDSIYSNGYRMEKETTGSYTKDLRVSVDGEEAETISIQVPEKETPYDQEEDAKPDSAEVTAQDKLREAVEQYNETKQDPDYYYLPDQWNGKSLVWIQNGDRSGTLLASLALFAGFVLLLRSAKEKQQELMKRREQLLMDYPALIMKFTLLVQAGMTARKTFRKIGSDYLRNASKEPRIAYEEILALCHEMDSGVAEMEAYRRFGERCGQMKYKTFSTLLIQNLQKGSRRMADMLEKEALEAWDERKRKARVLGEAAATKLLFPMILMLLVVMAVIMIPAFLSFYG